jgi:hypothetical protein
MSNETDHDDNVDGYVYNDTSGDEYQDKDEDDNEHKDF